MNGELLIQPIPDASGDIFEHTKLQIPFKQTCLFYVALTSIDIAKGHFSFDATFHCNVTIGCDNATNNSTSLLNNQIKQSKCKIEGNFKATPNLTY